MDLFPKNLQIIAVSQHNYIMKTWMELRSNLKTIQITAITWMNYTQL